jgi:hypothetical protein
LERRKKDIQREIKEMERKKLYQVFPIGREADDGEGYCLYCHTR